MEVFYFALAIPRTHLLAYYQGHAQHILTVTDDGRRLQLPARTLRPFVTHAGLFGRFRAVVDSERRLLRLERVG